MLAIKLIVVALLACLSESRRHHGRIMGGQKAPPGKFPYQVSLQIWNKHHCGGSIINHRYILSAGHCFKDKKVKVTAMAGTTDWRNRDGSGVRYDIKKYVVHERYHPFQLNDIALLETTEKMTFGEYIKPIVLERDFVGAGEEVVVCGWGYTRNEGRIEDHLQYIKSKTVSHEECEKADKQTTNLGITKGQICALTKRGEGSCYGDSGGALANKERNKLIGIVSRGLSTPDELGLCATGFPDVYTRVSEYMDWIEKHTK